MHRDLRRAEHRPAWAAQSPCRSSRGLRGRCRPGRRSLAAAWAGERHPCGREVRKREKRKAWLQLPPRRPLLTGDAAAETADRTRTGRTDARRLTRRCEHGPAEILLEAVGDILPKLGDLVGGTTFGINFHHRAAVDHRRREI